MTDELTHLSAAGIARRIRDGDISPTTVVDAFLERIADRNERTNAFVTVTEELAREQAQEAETAIENGEPLGPLHGVPVAIKDLDNVAGVRTTFGSKLYEDNVAAEDDLFVSRLKDAGAIIVGKTNTPEFGLGLATDNLVVGPTGTPFDPEKISGGSSGGAGAALGDSLVPIAQGSDTGGSIRVPAACCGVFGHKPTFGLVPERGRPNAFSNHTPFSHLGPMSRTVEDAAVMLDVMAGPDGRDPFSLPDDGTAYADAPDRPIDDLKIAYSPDLGTYPVAETVTAVLDDAVNAFEHAGASVERVDPDLGHPKKDIVDAYYTFANILWGMLFENLQDDGFDPYEADREKLRPYLVDLILDSDEPTMTAYRDANIVRTDVLDGICDLFEEYDLLVSATMAVPPFTHDEYPTEIDGTDIEPYRGWILTQPYNLTGQPAASAPAGVTDEGLPIGMQIAAPRHRDEDVLAAAGALERTRPWRDAYPR